MSLILEALRKSEAERRLGRAPDLLAPMPVLRVSAPRRQWPLAGAGAFVLVIALGAAWWWARNALAPPVVVVAAPSAQDVSAVDAGGNAAINVHRDALQTPAATRMTRISPTIALPISGAPRVAVVNHPVVAPVSPPTAPAKPVAIEPIPVTAAPGAMASMPAPASPVATAPAEPVLLSLADLSTGERNALPALKVSMHVYADDPARRFMIIDGQRVGEGARLADGVILVRIRRDGAELDARGRRLLLPKP